MGYLKAFLRQFPRRVSRSEEKKLDQDLHAIVKHLPILTKRDLLRELESNSGSFPNLAKPAKGAGARSESGLALAPNRELTAKECAEFLVEVDRLPEIANVQALRKALKKADRDWITSFLDNGGVAGIYKVTKELVESREFRMAYDGGDGSVNEMPEGELELEEELVRCVMVLLSKPQGLVALENSCDLLPLLARSTIDSSSYFVRRSLLRMLSTIVTDCGPSGSETVLNALDHVKADKNEHLRFGLLVEGFGDPDGSGLALVTAHIVLFNALISSLSDPEERLLLRAEMITAGILGGIHTLREYYSLAKVEGRGGIRVSGGGLPAVMAASFSDKIDLAAQLELFETVMNDDDEKHAKPTDESGVRGWVRVEPKPDPPAVASMRLVVGKLGANSETGVIVEVMAATMRRMADAHCSLAQWKRLKDTASSVMDSVMVEELFAESDGGVPKAPSAISVAPFSGSIGRRTDAISVAREAGGANLTLDQVLLRRLPPPGGIGGATKVPITGAGAQVSSLAGGKNVGGANMTLDQVLLRRQPPPVYSSRGKEVPSAGAGVRGPSNAGGRNGGGANMTLDQVLLRRQPPPVDLGGGNGVPSSEAGDAASSNVGGIKVGGANMTLDQVLLRRRPPPEDLSGGEGVPSTIDGVDPSSNAGGSNACGAAMTLDQVLLRRRPPPGGLGGGSGVPSAESGVEAGSTARDKQSGGANMTLDQMLLKRRPPTVDLGAGGVKGGGPNMTLEQMLLRPRPPPPPPMLGAGREKRIDANLPPRKKRRRFFWAKISSQNLENTVFQAIDPSTVPLPLDLLTENFEEKPEVQKTDAKAAPKKPAEAKKVALLDGKKMFSIGITFKQLKAKPSVLRDSLVAMDISTFDADKLNTLRLIAPNDDDLSILKSYTDDTAKLDEVTLFMFLTAHIPRYRNRLDCALFIKNFGTDADFWSEKLSATDVAIMEVKESPRLKRLIEVVLAAGNFMNEGTPNGMAKAIKLNFLIEADKAKTMDKRQNLLHVLMHWAKENEPDLLLLHEDLEHTVEASQWTLSEIKKKVDLLAGGFGLMRTELRKAKEVDSKLEGDGFVQEIERFIRLDEGRVEVLQDEYQRVNGNYVDLAKWFGEDPGKMDSGEFFALLSEGLDKVAKALRDNETAAKAAERRKRREAKEAEAQKRKKSKTDKKRAIESPSSRESGGGRILREGRDSPPNQPCVKAGKDISPDREKIVPSSTEGDDDGDDSSNDADEGTEEYERLMAGLVQGGMMLEERRALEKSSQGDISSATAPHDTPTVSWPPSMTQTRSERASLDTSQLASNLRWHSIKSVSMASRALGRSKSLVRQYNSRAARSGLGKGLHTRRSGSEVLPGTVATGQLSRSDMFASGWWSRKGDLTPSDIRQQPKTRKSTKILE